MQLNVSIIRYVKIKKFFEFIIQTIGEVNSISCQYLNQSLLSYLSTNNAINDVNI